MAIIGGDWRHGAAYDRLLAGDRRCFAWEWLRRRPDYAAAWDAGHSPGRFGLIRLEDPTRDAVSARPIWDARIDRGVLKGTARTADTRDRLDLSTLRPLVTVVATERSAAHHVLLSDGLRSVRLDVSGAAPLAGPVTPIWRIEGILDVAAQLNALAQLAALARSGRFARSLHRPERRARRWIEMLRVHDALAAGATNREIVAGLFGVHFSETPWRAGSGRSWRLRVQRLAAGARSCLSAGPSTWLGARR